MKTIRKILAIVIMATLLLSIVACQKEPPTFVPPPFDETAQFGTPEVPKELGWSELNVNDLYHVSVCGVVKVNDDKADVYFTNPESNEVWLKLRIIDEKDYIIAETGLIKPGEYVKTITFDKAPKKGTKIAMKVMGYEPDTYYSAGAATLNTTVS